MILPLTLILLAAAPHPARAAVRADQPVKVWMDHDRVEPGGWARASVRLDQDGYLLVLASDVAGRVRVLFPLDPGADAFLRAGRTVDLRGRGGRGSFLVGQTPGTGVILAASSSEPLRFDGFVRGDHWDYGALDSAAGNSRPAGGGNPDEVLLGLVQQMAGGNQLAYDAVTYTVEGDGGYGGRYIDDAYSGGYGHAYGYWDPWYGYPSWYGYPYWYGCFDPFFCGPGYFAAFQLSFFYGPFYARPFFYRPFYSRPFIRVGGFARPYGRGYTPYVGGGYRNRGYVPGRTAPGGPPGTYRNRAPSYSRARTYAAPSGVRPYAGSPSGFRRYAAPSGFRSFGGSPARSYAPRVASPRMGAPAFRGGGGWVGGGSGRGGGGGGNGRGGGRRR